MRLIVNSKDNKKYNIDLKTSNSEKEIKRKAKM